MVLWQLDDDQKFPRLEVVSADEKSRNKTLEESLAGRGGAIRSGSRR